MLPSGVGWRVHVTGILTGTELLGRLQSLDWTSELDWWTDHFYIHLLTCRAMWKPFSLLSANTVMEKISRPTLIVKAFVATIVMALSLQLL